MMPATAPTTPATLRPRTPKPRSNPAISALVPPEAVDWFCPGCGRFIGSVCGTGVVVVVHRCGHIAHIQFDVWVEPPT